MSDDFKPFALVTDDDGIISDKARSFHKHRLILPEFGGSAPHAVDQIACGAENDLARCDQ